MPFSLADILLVLVILIIFIEVNIGANMILNPVLKPKKILGELHTPSCTGNGNWKSLFWLSLLIQDAHKNEQNFYIHQIRAFISHEWCQSDEADKTSGSLELTMAYSCFWKAPISWYLCSKYLKWASFFVPE